MRQNRGAPCVDGFNRTLYKLQCAVGPKLRF